MHAAGGKRGDPVRMSLHDGVLLIEFTGPLTAPALTRVAARAHAEFADRCCGFILDFRLAVLAATAEELDELVTRHAPGPAIYAPGAFVTNDEQEPVLRAHAISMARRQIFRKTFDDTVSAHDWVKLRVQSYRVAALRDDSALR